MDSLLYLISEEGIAVFIIVVLLGGIAVFGRWFAHSYTTRIDKNFAELLREIAEIKQEVIDENGKVYNITESLIKNSRKTGENIKAIESSLDTLLKFLNKNGK
jgi:2C-methyl-D-erythritol 2,4-cyclodiphosphate synthase